MRPIPKKLLPDTCTVRTPDETADYRGEFNDPVTVVGVRWQPAESLTLSDVAITEGAAGRVWIDAENSTGGFLAPVGSLVSIHGDERQVVMSAAYETVNGHVHHWEWDLK